MSRPTVVRTTHGTGGRVCPVNSGPVSPTVTDVSVPWLPPDGPGTLGVTGVDTLPSRQPRRRSRLVHTESNPRPVVVPTLDCQSHGPSSVPPMSETVHEGPWSRGTPEGQERCGGEGGVVPDRGNYDPSLSGSHFPSDERPTSDGDRPRKQVARLGRLPTPDPTVPTTPSVYTRVSPDVGGSTFPPSDAHPRPTYRCRKRGGLTPHPSSRAPTPNFTPGLPTRPQMVGS